MSRPTGARRAQAGARTEQPEQPGPSQLVDRLAPRAVAVHRSVASKDELLSELAALMASAAAPVRAAAVEAALREREAVHSTAMGQGIAIPHATLDGLPRTCVGVMTLAAPIAFGEGELVDVCFCLLGPPSDRGAHLQLLAAIAGAVMQGDLLPRMRAAQTRGTLLEALTSPGPHAA